MILPVLNTKKTLKSKKIKFFGNNTFGLSSLHGGIAYSYKGVLILICLLGIIITGTGCATRYYPQPTEYVSVSNGYAVIRSEEVSFAISSQLWTREPHKVNDYFTTFYIIVINQTGDVITVTPDEITLLDENRSQYDALRFNDVAEVILRDVFYREKFSSDLDMLSPATDERMLSRAYLMQDSFHYGDIHPNARKTGYIFFNRLSPRNQKFTIIFRGKEIDFIRR